MNDEFNDHAGAQFIMLLQIERFTDCIELFPREIGVWILRPVVGDFDLPPFEV